MWATASATSLSRSTIASTARGRALRVTPRLSRKWSDTTSTSRPMNSEVSHLWNQRLTSCGRLFTPMPVCSQLAWFARAGTPTRAIRSTVWTKLAFSRRVTGRCPAQAPLSSGATSTSSTGTISPSKKPKTSWRMWFRWQPTAMAALVASSAWSRSLSRKPSASISPTKSSQSSDMWKSRCYCRTFAYKERLKKFTQNSLSLI